MSDREYLRCDNPSCRKPVAGIQDGKLMILQRHGREWHMTTFTIRQVELLLEKMRASERRVA